MTLRTTTRTRPQRSRRLTRWAVAVAGAVALTSVALPGVAAPSGLKPGDIATTGCWQHPNPDGKTWTAWTSGGSVKFYERGEILEVTDTKSNGWRVVGLFTWCEGPFLGQGVWRESPSTSSGWQHRDSGPDQGAVDKQRYDYEFEEGRRVIFRACEKKMSTGQLRNCSNTMEAWS
ncbi:hypothetical protein [Jiangella sp. DSM 45060]|uniref:hypothetical protein n=1 Tax=Jiangella sp. DSM 45060 TaxID=1798224 RepID=UPI00087AA00E|nr:hypothetical protein [Jiangella sp. DSM 45060]SDT70519.1 hypothetical protein SAMN04515669_6216 [Jiangella sp. DSM 45060]